MLANSIKESVPDSIGHFCVHEHLLFSSQYHFLSNVSSALICKKRMAIPNDSPVLCIDDLVWVMMSTRYWKSFNNLVFNYAEFTCLTTFKMHGYVQHHSNGLQNR